MLGSIRTTRGRGCFSMVTKSRPRGTSSDNVRARIGSRLEPGNDGSRDADRRRSLGAHEIDAGPAKGQPERSRAGTIRTRPATKFSLSEVMGSDSLT